MLLLILIPVIASTVTMNIINIGLVRTNMNNEITEKLEEKINRLTDNIENRYRPIQHRLETIERMISNDLDNPALLSNVRNILNFTLEAHPEMLNIYLWFEPYLVKNQSNNQYLLDAGVTFYHNDKGEIVEMFNDLDPMSPYYFDYRGRNGTSWYIPTIEKNQFYWSRPYYDDSGFFMPMFTAFTTIHFPNGSAAGVLGSDVPLHYLNEYIDSLTLGNVSYAFVIDNVYNSILSHKNAAYTFEFTWNTTPGGYGFTTEDWVKTEQLSDEYQSLFTLMNAGQEGKIQMKDKVAFFRQIEYLNYSVCFLMDTKEIFAQIELIALYSWILTSLMTFFLIIILIAYANSLVKPIIQLTHSSKKIAAGDYSQVLNIKARDELAELILYTRNMVETLLTQSQQLLNQEKETMRLQRMESLGLMAGGIAHDFNNYLMGILGNIELIKMEKDLSPEVLECMNFMAEATENAKKLATQLLTFSKGGDPHMEPQYIEPIIKNSIDLITKGSKSLCEFELAESLPIVDIDRSQIAQVINNLLLNAVQAMPNGGNLLVKGDVVEINEKSTIPLPHNKYVRIQVIDNGIGISKDRIAKIFDPFYTTKKDGSGLGLSISYNILKRHNGLLTVDSEENKGSIFTFYLPLSNKEIKELEAVQSIIPEFHGDVLILEDNHLIQRILKQYLIKLGFNVQVASEGKQAIEIFQENPAIKLVILDLVIPGGIGGKETWIELRKINPQIKGIISSGYSNDPIIVNYREYNFEGVLSKPYKFDEIKQLMANIFH
jgi:signal transduction histidine kinase